MRVRCESALEKRTVFVVDPLRYELNILAGEDVLLIGDGSTEVG
jgi:hypothetical protein